MLRIEAALVLLSLLIAFVYPQVGSRWFERMEHHFAKLSQRRTLSVVLVGVTALVLRAAVLPVEPIPEPIVHDEFGYLLAADTFAHGRLTNPTHPMWIHFESFSILQKPTYQCFAQPGQGMILAFGKVVFGHPFWGVWLSVGLMCAAITWMLQGWLPPPWALLGGVLAILRFGVFGYWANSYWGGALGAIGGALVLGALPRIKRRQSVQDVLLMALGLVILAGSRPYEGFVFSLPVAFLLFAWILKKNSPPLGLSMRRVVLPMAIVLAFTAVGMGYYLWRVTGNPFRMPYQVERQMYGTAPLFLWQTVPPKPAYRHPMMAKMYTQDEFAGYKVFSSPLGLLVKGYLAWIFFLGPVLTLPVLMLAVALPRDFSLRRISGPILNLFFVLAFFIMGQVAETFYGPRYSSPVTGLLLAIILLAMRKLRSWHPAGVFIARSVLIICGISFMLRAAVSLFHIPVPQYYEFAWYQRSVDTFGRAAVLSKLTQTTGTHLVIVHYKPEHEPFAEWVYNDADIDHAKIVWAREMSPAQDQELIQYFSDRAVWVVDADATPPQLQRLK